VARIICRKESAKTEQKYSQKVRKFYIQVPSFSENSTGLNEESEELVCFHYFFRAEYISIDFFELENQRSMKIYLDKNKEYHLL